MHSKAVVQQRYDEFSAEFSSIENQCTRLNDELSEAKRAIEDLKDRIKQLFEEKRHAAKEDRASIQNAIQSLLDDKSYAHDQKNTASDQLREAKESRRLIVARGKSLASDLSREINNQQKNARRLSLANQVTHPSETRNLRSTVSDTFEFVRRILSEVRGQIGGNTLEEDLSFEAIPGAAASQKIGGLNFTEPTINDIYLTNDEKRIVPLEAYTVTDSLDVIAGNVYQLIEEGIYSGADAAVKIGELAVAYTKAILNVFGHEAILDLGGPGQPDILSLDSHGTLWVTESKGTTANSNLPSSGLRRTQKDGDVKLSLMENSADWIARSFSATLSSLDAKLESERDPKKRLDLAKLKDAYLASARTNFTKTSLKTQIVQVGFSHRNDLKPPYAQKSSLFDEWVNQTNPEKIIQIDVVPESSADDIGE